MLLRNAVNQVGHGGDAREGRITKVVIAERVKAECREHGYRREEADSTVDK